MKLQTTDSELHKLAEIDDTAREGTEFVRVPRAALRSLLRDHYTLCTARGVALKFNPTADQESLR